MIPARLQERLQRELDARREKQLLRSLSTWHANPDWINLADNDYLRLARDPVLVAAAQEAAGRHGCSSSASPLISGYQSPHEALEHELVRWHGFSCGMVWNSGYAANQAILSLLPSPGDIIFADRLIHNSMVRGILQSGARLIRYRHNDLNHLQELLEKNSRADGSHFVVTESVFSMDGDSPDLPKLVALKEKFPFFLIVDEAHATGWFGSDGNGLVAESGITREVDAWVGTLGKALGSQGAYTLFHAPELREYLINHAGEFIYSTYLSPIAASAALAGVQRARELSRDQKDWRSVSTEFRERLRAEGWETPPGDSPIVPIVVGESEATLSLATAFREKRILVGAIRPPTVAAGSSRLRLSLNRKFNRETADLVIEVLNEWRARQR